MIEPLSITTAIVALLTTCINTGLDIKSFIAATKVADGKIRGLLADVESFTRVLSLMSDTLGRDEVQRSFQSTGHIGNHWTILLTCIQDGQNTVSQLQATLDKVHKPVGWFDESRQHIRIQGVTAKITMFQQQIRSYRDTLQLSLQTVIL